MLQCSRCARVAPDDHQRFREARFRVESWSSDSTCSRLGEVRDESAGGSFCSRPSSLSSPPPPFVAALLCALPSSGQACAHCRVSVRMRVRASAVGRSWRSSRGTRPPSMRGELAQQRGELMRALVSATGKTWRACARACERAVVMRSDFTPRGGSGCLVFGGTTPNSFGWSDVRVVAAAACRQQNSLRLLVVGW